MVNVDDAMCQYGGNWNGQTPHEVIILISGGELRATPSAPTLGERDVWGTYPKLLYSGITAAQRQKHKSPEEEEDTGEHHIMFADNFSAGFNVWDEEKTWDWSS